MRAVSRHRLPAVLFVAVTFGAGCGDGKPRALPFPQLDARAPFHELAGGTVEETAAAAPRPTSFADRLAPSGAAPAGATAAAAAPRIIPLGGQLFGEIPPGTAWSWQEVEEGVTLIACRLQDNRLAALVYAEAFPARIQIAPSEEIQRFQLTVNPEGTGRRLTPSAAAGSLTGGLVGQLAKETGSGRTESARLLQLLATRTAGAGLGFHPEPGSFTGWKWVGKNERNVTVRLARFTGRWERQASLPAEIKQRLEALRKIPELREAAMQLDASSTSSTAAAGGVSAYLLVGSATDSSEQSGAHLALLWQQSSHQCTEGLSSFLASLGTTRPDSAQQSGLDGQVSDISQAAGLQLLQGEEAVISLDALQKPAPQPAAPAAPAGPASSPPAPPPAR